jgi:hypothetical protein
MAPLLALEAQPGRRLSKRWQYFKSRYEDRLAGLHHRRPAFSARAIQFFINRPFPNFPLLSQIGRKCGEL